MENDKVINLKPNHLEETDDTPTLAFDEDDCCCDCNDCCCGDCACEETEDEPKQLLVDEFFQNSIMSYAARETELVLRVLTKPEQLQAMYPGVTPEGIEELTNAYTRFYANTSDIIKDILTRFEGQDVSVLADAIVVLQALLSLQPISPISGAPFEWEEIPNDTGLFGELKKLFGSKWRDEIQTIQHNTRASSIYRFDEENETAFRIDGIIFQTPTRQYVTEDSIVPVEFPYEFRPATVQSVPDDGKETE